MEVDFGGAAGEHAAEGCGSGWEEEGDGAFQGTAAVYAEGGGGRKESKEEEQEQEGGREEEGGGMMAHIWGVFNGGLLAVGSLQSRVACLLGTEAAFVV